MLFQILKDRFLCPFLRGFFLGVFERELFDEFYASKILLPYQRSDARRTLCFLLGFPVNDPLFFHVDHAGWAVNPPPAKAENEVRPARDADHNNEMRLRNFLERRRQELQKPCWIRHRKVVPVPDDERQNDSGRTPKKMPRSNERLKWWAKHR